VFDGCVAARNAAAASLWGGGIQVIEQESIRKHAFTRHVMASFGGDDGDDDDCGSEGRGGCDDIDADDDHDDDDDDDDLERRRAKQQFAALKQQMLHTKQEDASSAQPKSQVEAVNMEELSGGLLDESVRYWTDFQQVTCGCCALFISPLADVGVDVP